MSKKADAPAPACASESISAPRASPIPKAGIEEMRRLAMQQGMRTLLQDAIEKAFKGVTDVKQARAIAVK